MSKLLALVGSTATGKSSLALELARKHGADILSCDSLLVYKGLNIGTAKPSAEEQQEIKHYGIDLVNPNELFNAGDYVRYALPVIEKSVKEKKPLLIVGGTGFYLKALQFGVWDAPATQPEIRKKLEESVAHLEPEQRLITLHQKLAKLDPTYAAKINKNDQYRVIRALEIIEYTGISLTDQLANRTLQNPLPYPLPIFAIDRHKLELERRIRLRTDQMFEQGLVNETKKLIQDYPSIPRCFQCVGYNEVLQHLNGDFNIADCREKISIATRQLAKKQRTFFKGLKTEMRWFELPNELEVLMEEAKKILS